jgi:hypothetical protein
LRLQFQSFFHNNLRATAKTTNYFCLTKFKTWVQTNWICLLHCVVVSVPNWTWVCVCVYVDKLECLSVLHVRTCFPPMHQNVSISQQRRCRSLTIRICCCENTENREMKCKFGCRWDRLRPSCAMISISFVDPLLKQTSWGNYPCLLCYERLAAVFNAIMWLNNSTRKMSCWPRRHTSFSWVRIGRRFTRVARWHWVGTCQARRHT